MAILTHIFFRTQSRVPCHKSNPVKKVRGCVEVHDIRIRVAGELNFNKLSLCVPDPAVHCEQES